MGSYCFIGTLFKGFPFSYFKFWMTDSFKVVNPCDAFINISFILWTSSCLCDTNVFRFRMLPGISFFFFNLRKEKPGVRFNHCFNFF